MEMDVKLGFLASSQAAPETGASSIKTSASAENKTFESTLNDKRTAAENEKKAGTSEKVKAKDDKKPGEKPKNPAETSDERVEAKETQKPERPEKPETAEKNEKVSETAGERESVKTPKEAKPDTEIEAPELTEEQTELMLAQIAEALGVTPRQLEEVLQKLEIQPNELAVPENMNKLVMEVKGMEEPAELLTAPEAAEALKKLREIVAAAANTNTENESPANMEAPPNPEAVTESVPKGPETVTEQTGAAKKAQTAAETAPSPQAEQVQEVAAEDGAPTEEKPQGAQPEAKGETGHVPQNAGAQAQNNRNFEGGDNPAGTPDDANQATPVVIQKGDETVVEIAGRTVSRSVSRPQAQAADVVNQIIDRMKIDFKPGQTEIKVNLRPQELGAVTVKLVSENGVVTAEIVTENSKAKELVEQNLQTLRESLKEQGVEVGGLSVSVGQQEPDERMMRFMREKTKSHARMTQIINRINGEETEQAPAEYANEAALGRYTVDYSA